jgi:hypothetical protein
MTPDAAPLPRGYVPQGQAPVRPHALGLFASPKPTTEAHNAAKRNMLAWRRWLKPR